MTAPFVLFDLDGTLSDSAASILASLEHAFEVNGLPPLAADVARTLLGPPFYDTLPPLVGDDLLWPVVEAYRMHYQTAMLESAAFAGVAELLAALHADGRRLAVATSKPEVQARLIVENLGMAEYFETVGGDELDGSLRTKALVIGKVLQRLDRPDPREVLMVGDREHDVLGARAHGIESIGVSWGYGLPGELEAVRPLAICATPIELGRALGLDLGAATR